MSKKTSLRELLEIVKGIALVFLCHFLALIAVFTFISAAPTLGIVFIIGFPFSQLLYVLPLTNYLKRQGKIGMMKGVIIGAVITALIYGSCYLLFS